MAEFAAPASEPGRSLEAAARDGRRSGSEAASLRRAARAGLAGASAPYPHGDRIRRAFGQYAPAGLRAHIGPAASAAAARMDAAAFVLDGRAAFAASPSLRTAAHEAVHLAHHERGGAALPHGVGGVGDRHERLADRVADTVAAGRSAEPLLAAALPSAPGPAVGPMLQLSPNAVSSHTSQNLATPWAQIQNQLPFNDPQAAVKLLRNVPVDELQGPFTRMMGRLKEACARAEKVTADINGDRPGKARSGDATQTAYGTLGQLEAYLNESPSPEGEQFEGGHLISDQVLGENSYEPWNFAPQRRNLNSPDYRAIEMIAAAGLKAKKAAAKGKAVPTATYKVSVKYPDAVYPVAREAVERLLGYASLVNPLAAKPATPPPIKAPVYKAGAVLPDKVELTPRVPTLWKAVVDTPSTDHEFKKQSTITAGKAMHTAFVTGEHNVEALPSATGEYTGPIKWAMDTMSVAKPKYRKSWGTIGSGKHSFTAVQSAPRNPKAVAASSAPVTTPAVTPTVPTAPTTPALTTGPPVVAPVTPTVPATMPAQTPVLPPPTSLLTPQQTSPQASPSLAHTLVQNAQANVGTVVQTPAVQTPPSLAPSLVQGAQSNPPPAPTPAVPTLPSLAQLLLNAQFNPARLAPPPSFAFPPPNYGAYGTMPPMPAYSPYGAPMGGGMMGYGYGMPMGYGLPMGHGFGGLPMGGFTPYIPPPQPQQQPPGPPARRYTGVKRDRDEEEDESVKKARGDGN